MVLGVGIRGALGDIDPPNEVLFQRARSKVKKSPLYGGPLVLPRRLLTY